jgi:hypothetical protein
MVIEDTEQIVEPTAEAIENPTEDLINRLKNITWYLFSVWWPPDKSIPLVVMLRLMNPIKQDRSGGRIDIQPIRHR